MSIALNRVSKCEEQDDPKNRGECKMAGDVTPGSREVQLSPGSYVPVAFHVWEGSNGETGLKMALSSWYFLHLREPVSVASYLVVLLVVVGCVGLEYGLVRWMGKRAERGRLVPDDGGF